MVSGVTQLYQLGLKMIFCEALDRPVGPVGRRSSTIHKAQARRRVPHNRASSGVSSF